MVKRLVYSCLIIVVLATVLFLFPACICLFSVALPESSFVALKSESATPVAGVILIPGLNLRSAALHEIANLFISRGLRVRVVSLHKPDISEGISAEQLALMWSNQVRREYQELRSQIPGKPLLIFGYSLGTLLALNLVNQEAEEAKIVILIAPPLKLRTLPSFLLSATTILPASFRIVSAAPERYRIESWTSAAEYQAFMHVRDMLDRQLPLLTRRELYGTVFLSTHDELVSHKDVGEVLARHAPKLEVHIVSSKGSSRGHLMLDEYSLGSQGWRELCGAIAAITTQMDTPLLLRRQTTATSYTNVSHPPSPRPDPPQ